MIDDDDDDDDWWLMIDDDDDDNDDDDDDDDDWQQYYWNSKNWKKIYLVIHIAPFSINKYCVVWASLLSYYSNLLLPNYF